MQATQERISANPDLLKEAGTEFYAVCAQVDDALEAKGVDLDRIRPDAYWFTVADSTRQLIEEKYSSPENYSPKAAALELVAATPFFVLIQEKLDENSKDQTENRTLTEDEAKIGVRFVSHYNNLIRIYARNHPEATTYEMTDSLIELMTKTGLGKDTDWYVNRLSDVISGAQQELITTQSLDAVGIGRPAKLEEDLQGIDYVKQTDEGYGIPIDVKSSSKAIIRESNHTETTSCVSRKGTILLWSQLSEREMAGRFQLSPDEAMAHGAKMASEIEKHTHNPDVRRVNY